MRFVIKPIYQLIEDYDKLIKHSNRVLVIFASKHKYKFSFPVLKIEINDVKWGEEGFISDKQCKLIGNINIKDYDLILVGCDAGLSRSPAIMASIYKLNGYDEIVDKIHYEYPFLNMDLYSKIVSTCMIDRGA